MSKFQTLGALVKEKRQERGIYQRALAEALGIDNTTISKIENDALPISEELIVRLAAVLEIDPDEALAAAGRVAADVVEILARKPELVKEIRANAA
jgi:transcriptional regulator with XRE-family HTH domain